MRLHFELTATATGSHARAGRFRTLHGEVLTPVFMPVGTQATVKGLTVEDLEAAGAQVLLANAYHLLLRPGTEVFARLGGIHRFMNWRGSVLTDSGGYQVFSLPTDRDHHRGRRRLSQLRRRHPHRAEPRAQHRDAARDRQRHHDGDGRVHPVDRRTTPPPRPRCSARIAGPSAAWRRAATRRRRSSASSRAPASTTSASESADYPDAAAVRRLRDRRPGGRRGQGGARALHGADRRAAAARSAALPDGRRHADRSARSRRPRRRHVRLHHAVGRSPSRASRSPRPGASTCIAASTSSPRTAVDAAVRLPDLRRDYSRAYLHHLTKTGEPLGWQLLTRHNLHFYHDLMRTHARSTSSPTPSRPTATQQRPLLARGDERAPADPTPAPRRRRRDDQRPASASPSASSEQGYASVVHRASGEIMHAGLDPAAEAQALYVEQSRLAERLREPHVGAAGGVGRRPGRRPQCDGRDSLLRGIRRVPSSGRVHAGQLRARRRVAAAGAAPRARQFPAPAVRRAQPRPALRRVAIRARAARVDAARRRLPLPPDRGPDARLHLLRSLLRQDRHGDVDARMLRERVRRSAPSTTPSCSPTRRRPRSAPRCWRRGSSSRAARRRASAPRRRSR